MRRAVKCAVEAEARTCVRTHLGLDANFGGKLARQFGHVFLPCACHLLKHARQKLCWHGACVATRLEASTL